MIQRPEIKPRISESQRTVWRLLIHAPAPGAWNMAVDEAIGMAAAEGDVYPTVRFYAWDPPCISVGRHQALADIDLNRCRERGVDVVRRPTGGRAILHTDEFTYSIAAPPNEPRVAGAVLDAYHRLSTGLVAGLRRLGIAAEEAPGSNRAGPDVSAACFEVPSAYEITTGGRKLLGSAQHRRVHYVLQHGSLPLRGDVAHIVEFLRLDEGSRHLLQTALRRRAATVEELLAHPVSFTQVAVAMQQGLADALSLDLQLGELTEEERTTAARLVKEKYGAASWTASK